MASKDDGNLGDVFNKMISISLKSKEKRQIKLIRKNATGIFVKSKAGTFKVGVTKSEMEGFRGKEIKQRFVIKGKLLRDDNLTVEECGFNDTSVISVVHCAGLEVTVECLDRQKVMFQVRKDDKIKDIVKEIQNMKIFDTDEHVLMYRDSMLDQEEMMIHELGYVEGDVIKVVKLVRDQITIGIKTTGYLYVTLEVRKSDRIIDVKKKIHEKMGLSPDDHKLVYRGLILYDDNKTVNDYNIVDNCVINVETRLRCGMTIFAKTMDGKTVAFEVTKSDTIIDIKKKIQKKTGLSPDEQILHVGRMFEDDFTFLFFWTEEDYNIDDGSGVIFDDDNKTVDECSIVDHCTIFVKIKVITIFVRTVDGNYVNIKVTKSDTIIDIKKKIQYKMVLSLDEHKLVYEGGILDDDNKTVDECGIVDNGVICFMKKGGIMIYAKTINGMTFSFDVTQSDTIIDVKKKIQYKTGLSPDEQILQYQGLILEDDNKTVNECGITEFSTIDIMAHLPGGIVTLHIRMVGGTITEYAVLPLAGIRQMKEDIFARLSLLPNDHVCMYQGRELEDDRSIDYYDFKNEDVIDIVSVLRVTRYIFVRLMNGDTVPLPITNWDRVIDFKKKIHDINGFMTKDMVLRVNWRFLRDDSAILYDCISDWNCVIHVGVATKITLTLQFENTETIQLVVLNTDRIIDLKKKIQEKTGLPCDEQKLFFIDGTSIDETCGPEMMMDECGICDESDIRIYAQFGDTKTETQGICLVISNEIFANGLSRIIGTDVDVANIKETFEALQFEVKIERNVPISRLNEIIDQTKTHILPWHKMLIVLVMSHGDREAISMTDRNNIPIKDIWQPFSNEHFETLNGSPKMFFFACCSGSDGQSGNVIEEEINFPGPDTAGGLGVGQVNLDVPADIIQQADMSDVLIGYATYEGHPRYRAEQYGTPHVSTLCRVVREKRNSSVNDILTEVNKRVSEIRIDGRPLCQIPYYCYELKDYVYFTD